MSLADFVKEHVHEDEPQSFVPRKDLVSSYIHWRQRADSGLPTMQLSHLEAANKDSQAVLPENAYRPTLKVATGDGHKGLIRDCWQGYRIGWQGGERSEPEPVQRTSSRKTNGQTVHACFHFKGDYDPRQLDAYVLNRVTQPSPDDISYLGLLLRHTVKELNEQMQSDPGDWAVRSIEHQGFVFNVFVGRRGLQGAYDAPGYF